MQEMQRSATLGLLISVLYFSMCVCVCQQKDAMTIDQLDQALTAQSMLGLQIIGVNRDFSGHSKAGKYGN